jgi:hypothetical protein
MFQELKNFFFFKRLIKESIQSRKNLLLQDYSTIKTIGIAYDASDFEMITTVRDLENKLKNEGKIVSVFGFINSEDKKHEPFLFTRKDLNWYGYPTKQQLFDFAAKDFDIVLGFFNELNSPLNAIFANSKSKLRLGVNYNQEPSLFDIILGYSNKRGKKEIVRVLMDFITSIKTQ